MPDPIDDFNKTEPVSPEPTQPTQDIAPGTPAETPSASDNAFSTVPSIPETPPEQPSVEPFTPDTTPVSNNKKKYIFAGIGVAVALLALVGGTAYAVYFSNPEKVLLDAFQNVVKAKTAITKGDFTLSDKSNGGTVSVEFSTQSDNEKLAGSLEAKVKVDYGEVKFELEGAGMAAESGDYYFKIKNAPELFDQALKTEYGQYYASEPALAPLVAKLKAFFEKIDGKWIRVDKEDIAQYQKDYDKQQDCTDKAVAAFYKSNEQQQQVIDAYSKSRFVKVEDSGKSATINSQDSVAYDIAINVKDFNTFGDDFVKTDFAKALDKCVEDTTSTDTKMTSEETKQAQEDVDKIKTTLWISRWSHELQKVQIENKDKKEGNVALNMTLDTKTKPDLKDPSDYLKAKDLMQELQAIYVEAFGAYSSGSIDTTQI